VLVVPRHSVGGEAGHEFVMLKSSGSWEKRAVKIGPRNDLEVVVRSGVAEGELIQRTIERETGAQK
jgi:hypothetical protein